MQSNRTEATAYDSWAEVYDATDADRTTFISFYSSLLNDRTRSLLELGCGTGTVLSALAAHLLQHEGDSDVRAVGVDGSAGMLKVARTRDDSVEWIFGDMRAPPVHGLFDLVFSAFNSFQHLLIDEDLAQTFAAARMLLAVDGILAFDIYQPNLAYLKRTRSDSLAREVTDRNGRHLQIREDARYDADARTLGLKWRLVDRDRPEQTPLAQTSYRLRQYFPDEIERLLAQAGLHIRERYGDFDRSPFTAASRKQILVCERN